MVKSCSLILIPAERENLTNKSLNRSSGRMGSLLIRMGGCCEGGECVICGDCCDGAPDVVATAPLVEGRLLLVDAGGEGGIAGEGTEIFRAASIESLVLGCCCCSVPSHHVKSTACCVFAVSSPLKLATQIRSERKTKWRVRQDGPCASSGCPRDDHFPDPKDESFLGVELCEKSLSVRIGLRIGRKILLRLGHRARQLMKEVDQIGYRCGGDVRELSVMRIHLGRK
jgi:hypothetical protein